jgi:hypothetical protein
MSPIPSPSAFRRGARLALGLASALLATLTAAAPGQSVITLSDSPAPQESLEPVVGFRSYDSLLARHEDLYLGSDLMDQTQIGSSFAGRPIFAYRITGTGPRGVDGTLKPPVMFEGLIHAREWIAGEVVTRLIEKLVLEHGTDPIVTYLVDHLEIVCVPVSNPDGFLQTQRYFNTTVSGGFGGGDDGRLRRKNMKNANGMQVDEVLSTFNDYLQGVDLNRNHEYGWPIDNSATSITYNGAAPGSEPESQALYVAAGLVSSTSRLRTWFDFHSYGEDIYYIRTGVAARDATAQQFATRMSSVYQAVGGAAYSLIPVNPGEEIGATDEYFSHEFQTLGHTIELPSGGGGTGGFVMPNNEIAPAVAENLEAALFAFYYSAGPPIVERVVLWQDGDADGEIDFPGEVAHDSFWAADVSGTARTLSVSGPGVRPGEAYNVWITANKPLRRDLTGGGAPSRWPGVTAPVDPTVLLSVPLQAGGSSVVPTSAAVYLGSAATGLAAPNGSLNGAIPGFARYQFDSWRSTVSIPAGAALGGDIGVDIRAADMYGHLLDGRPQTVADWNAGWILYENGPTGANGAGGPDVSHSIAIVDTIDPTIEFDATTTSVSETGLAQVEVRLSEAAGAGGVSVDFAVVGGTASEPDDYSVSNGSLTLEYLEGEQSAFIELALASDLLDEADETVLLELSNPTGFVLGARTTHTVTIVDANVPVAAFDLASSSISEAEDTALMLAVTLDIAAGPAGVSLPFSAAVTSTASPADYMLGAASPLTFAAGETTAFIALNSIGDGIDEEDEEMVVFELAASASAQLGAQMQHAATIVDADDSPEVAFAITSATVAEGDGSLFIEVVLSAPTGRPSGVDLAFEVVAMNSTAEENVDFTLVAVGAPVFAEGSASFMLELQVANDSLFEGDETVEIALTSPVNATLGAQATFVATITSADPPPPPDGIVAR